MQAESLRTQPAGAGDARPRPQTDAPPTQGGHTRVRGVKEQVMSTRRTKFAAGLGLMILGAAWTPLTGCASSGSTREDYFTARAVSYTAQAGDRSVVALHPEEEGASWSASVTYVPLFDQSDVADGR